VSDEELDSFLACLQIQHEIVWGIVHGFVHVYTAHKGCEDDVGFVSTRRKKRMKVDAQMNLAYIREVWMYVRMCAAAAAAAVASKRPGVRG
jgi:hypothetical protein